MSSSNKVSNKDLPSPEELKHRITELYAIKNILIENYNLIKLIDDRIKNFQDALSLIEKVEQKKESLVWIFATGPHGVYELCHPSSNPEYLVLLKELQDHNGKMRRQEFFLWLFKDNVIGRKRVK